MKQGVEKKEVMSRLEVQSMKSPCQGNKTVNEKEESREFAG